MANYVVLVGLLISCTLLSDCFANEWGNWYPWTSCSLTCGVGTRTRARHCEHLNGGGHCEGSRHESAVCSEGDCSEKPWSSWTACTNSLCDGDDQIGSKLRWREGRDSISTETAPCRNPQPCSRDGGWSKWNRWSACSATCGQGYHYRKRSCNNPKPVNKGGACVGPSWQTTACLATSEICYRPARFGPWGDWSNCRRRSGGCQRQRRRRCEYPAPTEPGSKCNGTRSDRETCECP